MCRGTKKILENVTGADSEQLRDIKMFILLPSVNRCTVSVLFEVSLENYHENGSHGRTYLADPLADGAFSNP